MSATPDKIPQQLCPICGNGTTIVRTFDEIFGELHVSAAERRELVYHLAALRARKTIESLLNPPASIGMEER